MNHLSFPPQRRMRSACELDMYLQTVAPSMKQYNSVQKGKANSRNRANNCKYRYRRHCKYRRDRVYWSRYRNHSWRRSKTNTNCSCCRNSWSKSNRSSWRKRSSCLSLKWFLIGLPICKPRGTLMRKYGSQLKSKVMTQMQCRTSSWTTWCIDVWFVLTCDLYLYLICICFTCFTCIYLHINNI